MNGAEHGGRLRFVRTYELSRVQDLEASIDLLEHQGKDLLAAHDLPVPRGRVANTAVQAAAAARSLGCCCLVKAQVPTGGRGKAGGLAPAVDAGAAHDAAARLLGSSIKGHRVGAVLVEEAVRVERELYAAVLFDRGRRRPILLVSSAGGVDVESTAKDDGDGPLRLDLDLAWGLDESAGRSAITALGLDDGPAEEARDVLSRLWDVFVAADASLVEVNPLGLTASGLVCLDAKVVLDDAAAFRHPERPDARGSGRTSAEQRGRAAGLSYVELDGDIGIVGNGAGLVMSTLDLLAAAGGRPADFLDIGGGATPERMRAALELVVERPQVRAVLVNVFGGITRCDAVARGLIDALAALPSPPPVVVRLDGTNAAAGRRLLRDAGHPALHPSESMREAAAAVVELARREGPG